MIFDDHDVTDDWNLSVKWQMDVYVSRVGRRIVANAMAAYWLCQGYGNDPEQYSADAFAEAAAIISEKDTDPEPFEGSFWRTANPELFDKWEFATPTYPFIYFLDTRTRRGQKDPVKRDNGAPAYLKSIGSWKTTSAESPTDSRSRNHTSLSSSATTPVFNFASIESAQEAYSAVAGPYPKDLESWAANREHWLTFLRLIGDTNTVILSGDVHYGFTSTAKFSVFDDAATSRVPLAGLPLKGFRIVGAAPTYRYLYHAKFIN